MGYGIQLMAKNDLTGALDYFHRAQQLTPHYPELLINLAIAEDATKQTAPAEEHFKEALELAPSSPDGYIYYARYLLSHSRGDEARALLKRALELTPNDLTARELLKQTDLASPFQDHGVVHIGRNEEINQADPKAFVRKKLAEERDGRCTIHFVISFAKADNERLKIT
jgi:tetratricopeptide (TPR) repeat protein